MFQQVNRYCHGHKCLFCSFDRGVKSYSVNKAPGTGLMITKIPPSVSYSRFLFIFFFFSFSFVRGKSFRKVLEGGSHKGAWSVCLCRVRNRELISLLLLTWCVTSGKPRFLCGPCPSLPVIGCHSTLCKRMLFWFGTLFTHSLCRTGVEKSQILFAFSHWYLVGMISCCCWYSPRRLKRVKFFVSQCTS